MLQSEILIVPRSEIIFHSAMTVPAWPCRDEKTLPPDMEEELIMEAWYLLKNEEEVSLSPLPTFPLIIKL